MVVQSDLSVDIDVMVSQEIFLLLKSCNTRVYSVFDFRTSNTWLIVVDFAALSYCLLSLIALLILLPDLVAYCKTFVSILDIDRLGLTQ